MPTRTYVHIVPVDSHQYVTYQKYESIALTLWTVPVWTPDQLALAMLFTAYCLFAPKFKEARFEKRYGARFRAYRARVPYALPCLKGSKYHDNNSPK